MRKLIPILLLIPFCFGCQTAGRDAAIGAFDAGKARLEAWYQDKKPVLLAEAKDIAGQLADKAKVEAQAYAVEKLDTVAAKAQASIDTSVAAAKAKQDSGAPLSGLDWFWLAVGASGIGAGGVASAKAMLRALFDSKVAIDPASLPDHLQTPPKPA